LNANPKHTVRLEGLQVLRGIAALLVMWCHLKYNLGVPAAEFSNVPVLATDLGAIGVDIFFVISGYVIAMTAANMGNNWREFLAHRTARVVPLYFTLSTCMLVLMLAGLDGSGTNAPRDSSPLSFRQIFNTYAFLPVFDTATFTNPLCVNGWTLSFEIWFYLCFAWLIKFFNGSRAGQVLPFFMTAGVMATAAFYRSSHWFLPKFLFHPLTLEFCAGCVLFHLRDHIGKVTLFAMGLLGLGFLYVANQAQFLGVHWGVLNNQALGFYRAEIWGGFAVCLVGAVIQMDLKHPRWWPKFLLLLGDASYSIYLVAPLVMLIVNAMILGINKLTGSGHLTMPPFLCGIIYILGTILGGIALWKYFEVPTTRKVKKLLLRFVPKTI
jgi:exopolysaccharide production protein ExoZ